jgi:hypothetical protein
MRYEEKTIATRLGNFTLDAPRVFGGRCFESASQCHTVLVPAGVYPIEAVEYHNGYGQAWRYVRIALTGTVAHSSYGAKVYTDQVGQPDTWSEKPYKYEMRNAHDSGELLLGGRVEITDRDAFDRAEGF